MSVGYCGRKGERKDQLQSQPAETGLRASQGKGEGEEEGEREEGCARGLGGDEALRLEDRLKRTLQPTAHAPRMRPMRSPSVLAFRCLPATAP